MEELFGYPVRIVLNSLQGVISVTGILMKLDNGFLAVENPQGKTVYYSVSNVKMVEKI